MRENGEIYTTGKNFTLQPAVTAWTNLTSEYRVELVDMILLGQYGAALVGMVQYLFSTWWYWLVLGGNGSV